MEYGKEITIDKGFYINQKGTIHSKYGYMGQKGFLTGSYGWKIKLSDGNIIKVDQYDIKEAREEFNSKEFKGF